MTSLNSEGLSRRSFAQRAAAFTILPAHLLRGYAANEKLNLGIIGLAGMGSVDARTFNALGDNISAICDVDAKILERRGAPYPNAARYTDFRKMIEKEKLDGVIVAVPDHNHAYISVFAMRHGLHVYCQKPLCKSVHEARVMARVAAETKKVTQMGTQSSAEARILRTVEFIQSGAIGDVTEVHLTTDRPIWPQGHDRVPGEDPIPDGLDWDLWLGTAEKRPFQAKWPAGHAVFNPVRKRQFAADATLYHPFSWRGWWDFGSGGLGDMGIHNLAPVFDALKLGPPVSVHATSTPVFPETVPVASMVHYEFAARGEQPAVKVHWYDGGLLPERPEELEEGRPLDAEDGIIFVGDRGKILVKGWGGETPRLLPESRHRDFKPPTPTLPRSVGHHAEWIQACKQGTPTASDFDFAGPLTEAVLLGSVAIRMRGEKLRWDSANLKVPNLPEAEALLHYDYRPGWTL